MIRETRERFEPKSSDDGELRGGSGGSRDASLGLFREDDRVRHPQLSAAQFQKELVLSELENVRECAETALGLAPRQRRYVFSPFRPVTVKTIRDVSAGQKI
jgi:hypothetical protein